MLLLHFSSTTGRHHLSIPATLLAVASSPCRHALPQPEGLLQPQAPLHTHHSQKASPGLLYSPTETLRLSPAPSSPVAPLKPADKHSPHQVQRLALAARGNCTTGLHRTKTIRDSRKTATPGHSKDGRL